MLSLSQCHPRSELRLDANERHFTSTRLTAFWAGENEPDLCPTFFDFNLLKVGICNRVGGGM